MKTLHISVSNKVAEYRERDGFIVCGNSNYQVEFAFDSEWDEHEEKTARFVWNNQYFDQEFTGNVCPCPIIYNTTEVSVGVYAGNLETTTGANIPCIPSILCGEATQSPESAERYTNEAKQAAEEAKRAAEEAKGKRYVLKTVETEIHPDRVMTAKGLRCTYPISSGYPVYLYADNSYGCVQVVDSPGYGFIEYDFANIASDGFYGYYSILNVWFSDDKSVTADGSLKTIRYYCPQVLVIHGSAQNPTGRFPATIYYVEEE